ncbi:MAG: methyltransferase [Desulfatirhabdiaceae bacterium]
MNPPEWNPGKILETSGAYWKTCALHAGVKLNIFTIIGDRIMAGEDVAERIHSDSRATIMLLNALCAMNLLNKLDDGYRNTMASKSYLSEDSAQYIGFIIRHHQHLMASWSQLDVSVKTGKPIRNRVSFADPEVREAFLMGMFNMAMNTAPSVIPQIDLGNRRQLLDLGGGPGTWAIHFCMTHPEMKATVFDLHTSKHFAEQTITRFGMSERIQFQGGSYLNDEIRGNFDVAWLSHILHGEGPESCQSIIHKAASVLSPGGMILIHEFILNNAMDSPLFPALFSLNMLLGTESGQAYSEQALMDMLAGAGFKNIHRIPVVTPNDSGVIAGYK